MASFFGHLHPLLVHLPIGILLFAILLQSLAGQEKYMALQPAMRLALFWGMVSALASAITGLLLSQNGEYDAGTLNIHRWLGISLALISALFYVWKRKTASHKNQPWVALLLLLLIIGTGHMGGTLTHGEGYLTQNLPSSLRIWLGSHEIAQRSPISNIDEAAVYGDVISPILQAKCYDCHGPKKQKGGLRMNEVESFKKGGKNGVVFVAGMPQASEMLRRVLLELGDEDHMPPQGKPQLTNDEITLMQWWIATGASFEQKVKDLPMTAMVKTALQNQHTFTPTAFELPAEKVEPADENVIRKLKDAGVLILPLAKDNNYLEANFVNADIMTNQLLKLMEPLTKQMVWLSLADTPATDSACVTLAKLTQLRKLHLQNTKVTDTGLGQLRALTQLQYLNLVGTAVTAKGLTSLRGLKRLQQLYLYQTSIDSAGLAQLRKIFPNTRIDSGGYTVTTLPTDTTEVKPPKAP
jgi:uncharacterized membrane protein